MRSINEKCAVIGVTNQKDFDVSRLVYLGLWSLQHRGQESSGIVSFDGIRLQVHKDSGLVSQVYDESSFIKLKGQAAIGHNRYSTSGGKDSSFNQPYVDESINFALAHNGNLPFTDKLVEFLTERSILTDGLNDTGLMTEAIAYELKKSGDIVSAIKNCWNLFTGAFCCTGLYGSTMFAFRDSHGIRPLALGKTTHGYVVASETVALDIIGADFTRYVRPGELIVVDKDEVKSYQIAKGSEKIDAFEFVYLARPDSRVASQSVYSARFRAGKALWDVAPVKADVIIGVPDSGLSAAAGISQASGIASQHGLIKNRYIGRTFIEPEKIRRSSVELKFNVIVEIVSGKDIILVDDSLVRGNTLKYVIKILRDYGARKVHVRIASPPVKYPDFYGIDTPNSNHLLANEYSEEEITQIIGADSLAYLPLDDFIKSTGVPESRLCLSSFNGVYPIKVPYKPTVKTSQNS